MEKGGERERGRGGGTELVKGGKEWSWENVWSAFRTTGERCKLKSSSGIHSSPKAVRGIMVLWQDLNSN